MADGLSFTRAKAFRRLMTPPEARLWNALRAGRLNGCKFRRQHPIGPYILDFYCAEAKLAVEVDGAVHDQQRTAWLGERGVKVVRVRAIHVKDELEGVLGFTLRVVRSRDAG